jgi:RNA polymerase sigma-70 factor, ECF subfamily
VTPLEREPARPTKLARGSREKKLAIGNTARVGLSPSQRLTRDESFERLYRRHRRDVYGAVLRDVRDPDEAEDVTQIAFLNAFRALRRGEEPEKPRAWLVAIARNVVRRRYRALATRPREVMLDPDAAPDLSELDGPSAGEIAAAIRRLPPNQRAVILLREIQGLSYAEIATELDLSLAAVETLIFRARGNLAGELELSDHTPSTRQRLARRLRGLLPFPGLGKLSLGFSVGRVGMAAVAGGVAIMTVPIGDVAADPPRPPAVQRTPSLAERAGPQVSPVRAAPGAKKEPVRKVRHPQANNATGDDSTASKAASDGDVTAGAASTLQNVVSSVQDAVPLPTVTVPTVTVPPVSVPTVTVPTLPVEPPTLPPSPPLPEVDVGVDLGG